MDSITLKARRLSDTAALGDKDVGLLMVAGFMTWVPARVRKRRDEKEGKLINNDNNIYILKWHTRRK